MNAFSIPSFHENKYPRRRRRLVKRNSNLPFTPHLLLLYLLTLIGGLNGGEEN